MKEKHKTWRQKNRSEKTKTVVSIVLLTLFSIGTIVAFVFSDQIFGEDSIFNRYIADSAALTNLVQKIPAVIRTVQIAVIAVLIYLLISLVLKKCAAKMKRGLTVVTLLNSFVKYVVAIIALLVVLGAWGVNTSALLASAGILGLVVGLGAQSLISDIIAGIFIVFEGDYQIGDIVVIDDWRGTVSEIGIRTTKIIDAGGNVKIINNSDIRSIVNQTQELSLALCEVGIEYGESIERVETVIRDNLDKMKERIPAIVEGPFYKGVKTLNSSSVDLLFVAKCKEEDLFQTQRDLNREIKLIFDKNNINIPFPQVVLNQPPEFVSRVSKKTIAGAQAFVEEQKELSKDIDEKV